MSGAGESDEITRSEAVLAEADELMDIAEQRSLTIRLAGSLAIRARCPVRAPLLRQMGRRPYRDIDVMAYTKQKRGIAAMLEERGYVLDPDIRMAQEFGIKRFVYENHENGLKVDVFFDELVMAHTIQFGGRLDLHHQTVDLTDLLLTKLQIHEFTDNDLIDSIVLLAEHDVGRADPDGINGDYIADILRKDWGFCYTTQANLKKIAEGVQRYPVLPGDVAELVRARATALNDMIERAPKTQRWKMRARVGERVRWYEQVEDVNR
jgi:hypothetical protein